MRSTPFVRFGFGLMLAFCVGCERAVAPRAAEPVAPSEAMPSSEAAVPSSTAVVREAPPDPVWQARRAAHRDDGNDDVEGAPAAAHVPAEGVWQPLPRAPRSLRRVCDLTAHAEHVYAAHANQPLGTDGATLSRFDPRTTTSSLAFDWNRSGEPSKGGGAGQGFLRLRRVTLHGVSQLYVADADPPYNGLGLADRGTEGYVFVSGADGTFARSRAPHHRPPAVPRGPGEPGALIVPRAYHVIDVARWRGALWASTGSVPPGERAWVGPSPGALHRLNETTGKMVYAAGYPVPYQNGVWRMTYMVRYGASLLAGLQDYDGREPNDFVQIDCDGAADAPCDGAALRVTPRQVTPEGGSHTLRWIADGHGRLYWVAWTRRGVGVYVSDDGVQFAPMPLPAELGTPSDLRLDEGAYWVLADTGLWRAPRDGATLPQASAFVRVAAAPLETARSGRQAGKKVSAFALSDLYCAPPLLWAGDRFYAGGQQSGLVYQLQQATASP